MRGPLVAALLAWAGGASGQGVPLPAWSFHAQVIQPEGRKLCQMTTEGEGWNRLTLTIDGGTPQLDLHLHKPLPDGPVTLTFQMPDRSTTFVAGTVAQGRARHVFDSVEKLRSFAAAIGGKMNSTLALVGPVSASFPALNADHALRQLVACAE